MQIMGIVNVTPDSFSDGGLWATPESAVRHARELINEGAQILDIGGESTRPGATLLSSDEEWQRIEAVIAQLLSEKAMPAEVGRAQAGPYQSDSRVLISVDTYHARTAQRAASIGATIINDVTGGQGDPDMFATVAELNIDYVLQHGRGNGQTMNSLAHYEHFVAVDVRDELLRARDQAVQAGIDPERIILDPGLGFAKLGTQDWDLLAGLDLITAEGHRVLVGASRKRFITGVSQPIGEKPEDRDLATAVISGLLAEANVWAVRVHNVAASAVAVRVHGELARARARYASA